MIVLVADDSRATRFKLTNSLTHWGYQVIEASDGDEAWSILTRTDPPRIAILDWMMPGKDGVEICHELTEHQAGNLIYTILLTSKTEKEDLVYGLDSGAHDFLSKPVHPEELRSRIAVGRRLVELNLLKNKFLGIAAHDLRSPITSIRNMAELMLDDETSPLSPEEQKEFLDMIVSAGDEMLALINDLLDISAIESGRLELTLKEEALSPLVEKRVRLFRINANKKEIHIVTRLEDTPPVLCDQSRLNQALDNFLSNALKYSPPGSTITVKLLQDGDMVRVSVSDQGPGLSQEDKANLFGEFQRLSAQPTGGESSTGLGLAIVKKIIEAHAGRLEVDSEEGRGATFSFLLPIH